MLLSLESYDFSNETKNRIIEETDINFSNYSVSLYWAAATLTSTGYGDVRAHTVEEKFFAVATMLLSMLLFMYSKTLYVG